MGEDALSAAVRAELDRLIPAGAAIGVAVSGGGDSTALLLLAHDWAQGRGLRLEAATVDHALRPESAAEARAVAALCARLNVPHATLATPDLRARGGNLSAIARDARLAALAAWARARGLPAVLLGHTLDDQAETVLMRLARGSGAEGLSGMADRRDHAGIIWLRPLLTTRRETLRTYLTARGVPWTDDPTNEAPEYDRVKARRALAALAPLGIEPEGLARTAWHLRRQRRVLERAMAQLAVTARTWGPMGESLLDPAPMAADEPDTALRLLADTLQRVSGAPYRPRFRALSALLAQVLAGRAFGATLSGCRIATASRGRVLVCREEAACEGPVPLHGPTLWDNRWRLTPSGPWPAGATVAALGEQGLAKLSRHARKSGATLPETWVKTPRPVRLAVPAIWSGPDRSTAEILAVPAANHLAGPGTNHKSTIRAENLASGELPST